MPASWLETISASGPVGAVLTRFSIRLARSKATLWLLPWSRTRAHVWTRFPIWSDPEKASYPPCSRHTDVFPGADHLRLVAKRGRSGMRKGCSGLPEHPFLRQAQRERRPGLVDPLGGTAVACMSTRSTVSVGQTWRATSHARRLPRNRAPPLIPLCYRFVPARPCPRSAPLFDRTAAAAAGGGAFGSH